MRNRSRNARLDCAVFYLDLQQPGPAFDGDHYGVALCVVGDVDGDGIADFAIGETSVDTQASIVDLRSGATGRLIWRKGTATTDANCFHLAAAGDIDRDGTPDILFSMDSWTRPEGEEGTLDVLSGRDGHVLRTFSGAGGAGWFARSIAGNVDFDHDGTPDIVIGSPGLPAGKAGHVFVYSGSNGHVLLDLESSPDSGIGSLVATGRDFDADGTSDIITFSNEGVGRPELTILSGVDGHCIRVLNHVHDAARPVQCIGIIDNATAIIPDVWISSVDLGENPGRESISGYRSDASDALRALSSFDDGGMFGAAMTTASDVDGDGVKDIVVGAPESQAAGFCEWEVSAWSGATGKLLWRMLGSGDSTDLGATLAGGIDVDGDCCEDILAGAVWINGGSMGRPSHVVVISGRTGKTLRVLQRDSP